MNSLTRTHKIIISGVLILLGALGWQQYLHYQAGHPSTDDAYVRAHVIPIAAQVSGPIIHIYVQDYALVHKGDPLFDIDPTPFQYAVTKAKAQLRAVQQNIKAAQALLKADKARVRQHAEERTTAAKNAQRAATLLQRKLLSQAQYETAISKRNITQSALTTSTNQLKSAEKRLGQQGDENTQYQIAAAALAQAELQRAHTHITAPADGYLTHFNQRVGAIVMAQYPLFSIVENNDWWIVANMKETDLARLQKGQAARITLDMYPDQVFKGRVTSIAPGSSAAFALLPPENATGNWVKVTQRFPVRIRILAPHNAQYPLRVGASSTVVIDTAAHHVPRKPH